MQRGNCNMSGADTHQRVKDRVSITTDRQTSIQLYNTCKLSKAVKVVRALLQVDLGCLVRALSVCLSSVSHLVRTK